MNKNAALWFFMVLIIITALAAGAWYAYNLGVAQGAAESVTLTVPEGGQAPAPYYYHGGPFFHRPFGWGFGPFFCLLPLLFFLLFFGFGRAFFWRGHLRRHGWHADWSEGSIPPGVADLHRRLHEAEGKSSGS